MQDTVAALFKDEIQAESAVIALRSAHFDSTRTEPRQAGGSGMPDSGSYAARGIEIGCTGGTLLGVVLGVVAAGLLPHTHPFLPGLFVPFMLAMAFGATGGLVGLLLSISAWHEMARLHALDVQSGRFLVSVEAEPERRDTARRIVLSKGAITAWPARSRIAGA
jgi:hypothetical protein